MSDLVETVKVEEFRDGLWQTPDPSPLAFGETRYYREDGLVAESERQSDVLFRRHADR